MRHEFNADVQPLIEIKSQVNVQHLRGVYAQVPTILIGNTVTVIALAIIFWPWVTTQAMQWWIGCATALTVWRYLQYRYTHNRLQSINGVSNAVMLSSSFQWRLFLVLQGLLWVGATTLFYGVGTPLHLTALLLIQFGLCVGAVHVLASAPSDFALFVALVLGPVIVRLAVDSQYAFHWQLAMVLTILTVVAVFIGLGFRRSLTATIQMHLETERVAAKLRTEMAVA